MYPARVVAADAPKRTQEMILDKFMNGFIWQLFLHKWTLYGRKIHTVCASASSSHLRPLPSVGDRCLTDGAHSLHTMRALAMPHAMRAHAMHAECPSSYAHARS